MLGKKAAGFHFFQLNNKETFMIHDHVLSKDFTLPRKGFSKKYIKNLNTIIFDKSILNEIIEFLKK